MIVYLFLFRYTPQKGLKLRPFFLYFNGCKRYFACKIVNSKYNGISAINLHNTYNLSIRLVEKVM